MVEDVGVLSDSLRFYYEGDDFAEAHLFSTPHAGIYHCNSQYEVERTAPLDACQLILVESGELAVEYWNQKETARAGMLVLLDCRFPHRYYAASQDLRIRWFHFVGNSSEAYGEMLLNTNGFVIRTASSLQKIEACFEDIMISLSQKNTNPHLLSAMVHRVLALLTLAEGKTEKSDMEKVIETSITYMENSYADSKLTVDKLAKMASISTCYYIRKFKQYRTVTPHQYLQTVRLRSSKLMLATTSRSIEEIAYNCGFCNASHFIAAFHKQMQLTPLEFRKMWR